jgi:predicted acyl esterase
MVGISYPGIAQLYVAQTRPPHLAAIAPLAVFSDFARDVVFPGGVVNDGFPLTWLGERQQASEPFGLPSAVRRRDQGDTVCIENQRFRGQNPDQIGLVAPGPDFVAPAAERLAPDQFVDRIEVPVFLAGAWQDESLGAGFVNMLDDFTGTDRLHLTLTNGGHGEAVMPAIAARYIEFLSFYVRREIPALTPRVRQGIQLIGRLLFSTSNVSVEPDRFADEPGFAAALAKFEAEPKLRILFENGAGGEEPGAAVPRFEQSFEAWPIPTTQLAIWHLNEGGQLTAEPPSASGADVYRDDPSLSRVTTVGEGGFTGVALPNWEWPHPADGAALAWETDRLPEPLVMVGTGSVDLWLRSTAADTDLQVTLSEVRPDGNEMFVQEGLLRASHRAVEADASTLLRPVHSQREADVLPLPAGEFSLARVGILPFGHVFRAGSRIRIQIATPGGTRPLWTYDVRNSDGTVVNTVARSSAHPSRIVLPVVPEVEVPGEFPPCPSLRFQYCRPYRPGANVSAADANP